MTEQTNQKVSITFLKEELAKSNELLKSASIEIVRFRDDNRFMRTRLQMFDDMMLLIKPHFRNDLVGQKSEDIVWSINNHLSKK